MRGNYLFLRIPTTWFTKLIVILTLLMGCTRNSAQITEDVLPVSSRRQAAQEKKKPKTRVTWDYLRYMVRNGENPSIYKLLKDRNKLIPRGAAKVADGGCHSSPWDPCVPDEFDEGDLASMRVDVPFLLNGQVVHLSLTVQYKISTGDVVSVGATVYGNTGNTVWTNYSPAAANYANGQMTVIANMQYTSSVQTTNTFATNVGGSGEVDGTGINVGLQYENSTQTTLSQTGVLYTNFSVNLHSAYGSGMIQMNGPGGIQRDYYIEPQ
ncbi:hypothetical protein IC229_06210 [Spirosoma sp. BT702]|uniref:Lipoprotein n=1 Tax=Spirosoma profusum TaxID=2771354 RepID=A0A926Y1F3_9BACT|nr:hypothetical protein [Spirosoma profusum]MBD2700220.1 hypothetical protein [Spirosoma profusum]